MASVPVSRPVPPRRPGFTSVVLGVLSGLIVSIFVSIVIGCAIEWIGMNIDGWWKAEGVSHSESMVREDLGYLAEYRKSLVTEDSVEFAASWAAAADMALAWVGVKALIRAAARARQAPAPASKFGHILRNLLVDSAPYLISGVFVVQDAAIRMAIVVLALPAFLIAVVLGLVDGFVRRDIRRWSGGRESSFVYHNAKRLLWPAFTGGFTLYLTWPTGGFNPAWMVLPFCAAAAWTIGLMAATFKKYL